jgi:hypothetical protein
MSASRRSSSGSAIGAGKVRRVAASPSVSSAVVAVDATTVEDQLLCSDGVRSSASASLALVRMLTVNYEHQELGLVQDFDQRVSIGMADGTSASLCSDVLVQ